MLGIHHDQFEDDNIIYRMFSQFEDDNIECFLRLEHTSCGYVYNVHSEYTSLLLNWSSIVTRNNIMTHISCIQKLLYIITTSTYNTVIIIYCTKLAYYVSKESKNTSRALYIDRYCSCKEISKIIPKSIYH